MVKRKETDFFIGGFMSTKVNKVITSNQGYYLPLVNKNGLVASITPYFSGDLKKGYYYYALEPISELGLFNLSNKRNIIFYIDNNRYDLNGQTERQQNDKVLLEIDQLTQKITRVSDFTIFETKSFVTVNDDLEIHLVKVVNNSDKEIKLEAFTSVPIYSRSPENIHDHRHVTSLLNVIQVVENGIINKPTLTFDERGHKLNNTFYSFFSFSDKAKISNYVPTVDEYINGGTMQYPKGLRSNKYGLGSVIKGYETMGTIGFSEITLKPNEEIKFSMIIGINDDLDKIKDLSDKYRDFNLLEQEYEEVKKYYQKLNNYIKFNIENNERTNQLRWVTLQPILRRLLGNSYLPHHDYGHGGRGWRDLWQDLLSLIYSADSTVKESIIGNFAGVRIDGSNATIIGTNPGDFRADRNQIVRVWSDHGAWPLLTVKMYIDETGDLNILNNKQNYFDDGLTHYSKKRIKKDSDETTLKLNSKIYEGTIFEHLLLQNLVGYFNIGNKGFTKLEDADWNDGLDMASQKGETIPFTMFYVNNLKILANLLENIDDEEVEIFVSLNELLNEKISIKEYFDKVSNYQGLEKIYVNKLDLIDRLIKLYTVRKNEIDKNAIIDNRYYQSYIDNDGNPLDTNKTISLTVHAMALISNIPSIDFSKSLAKAVKEKLYEKEIGGYRLNTNYNKVLTNMGRAYGFAYGHKENGAVFCHMATMYAYGLYNYNLVELGREAIVTLLNRALNEESDVLAGVPEYFNEEGKGKYLYLTGTASWLIKLYREQIFGIKMNYGTLTFDPKLMKDDFINNKASIETFIKLKKVKITYINEKLLDYGNYMIKKIVVDGNETNDKSFLTIGENVEVYLDEIN